MFLNYPPCHYEELGLVPQTAGYDPLFYILSVPSNIKRLENHTTHIKYDSTTHG
jgi:hypothetical protein